MTDKEFKVMLADKFSVKEDYPRVLLKLLKFSDTEGLDEAFKKIWKMNPYMHKSDAWDLYKAQLDK